MPLRRLIRYGARAFGVELRRYSLLKRAINTLSQQKKDLFFIQIGANNGIDFDDFFSVVNDYDLAGIVVEPLPYYFEVLVQAYKRHRDITPVQTALHPTDQQAVIYRADPDKPILGWQHGLGSFSRDHLRRHGVPEEAIISETVPCMSLLALVDTYVPADREIDILVSDTEGFDAEILKMIDFARIKPSVIRFESKHLTPADAADIERRLRDLNYKIEKGSEDWVAVSASLAGRITYLKQAMRSGK